VPLELFTARYQTFQPRMGVPVRTTIGAPRFKLRYPLNHNLPLIAPDRAFFHATRPEFVRQYRAKLDRHGPALIIAACEQIAKAATQDRLVLLCFEDLTKEGQWCHRTLFAEWFEEQTGHPVREIGGSVDALF
jgi:hypothetical protein